MFHWELLPPHVVTALLLGIGFASGEMDGVGLSVNALPRHEVSLAYDTDGVDCAEVWILAVFSDGETLDLGEEQENFRVDTRELFLHRLDFVTF